MVVKVSQSGDHLELADKFDEVALQLQELERRMDYATYGNIARQHHRRLHEAGYRLLNAMQSLQFVYLYYSQLCLESLDSQEEDQQKGGVPHEKWTRS
jgi:hypothetical protein